MKYRLMIGLIIIQSSQNLLRQKNHLIIKNSKDNFGVEGFGFGSMGGFYTLAEAIAQLR